MHRTLLLTTLSALPSPSPNPLPSAASSTDLTWYYNYGAEPSAPFLSSNLEFVPMLWGASDDRVGTAFYDIVKAQLDAGANINYVLGFNEPDGDPSTGGSQIPVDLAAATWIREIEPLRELGVKLELFEECAGRCNPDFMPVHWYGNFEGLASHVGQKMAEWPNMTIWVTEYADANNNLESSQRFYNQSAEWFDRMENITHYSYFGSFRSDVSNVGPNAAMLTQDGELTDIGSWYLGGAATNNIPEAKGAAGRTAVLAGWSFVVAFAGIWSIL
ncbi:hypothetical protein H2199_001022 [Coniosporium tulheliwenetii]|uniref:Uncharacterized protein n=1 Tax=Coniosporium tulheliwenetii TaxID=3383036 RepID=A0ACC2ZNT3_9PEZI|nr:hypothetical protein H2199_001022 [Cladosporium sp. JES 115]